jgi:isoleucyl-tRNA synthetase
MPFAQRHAPFEGEDVFRERFPADYICEALDQTRGWFYSLLAVSTLLFGQASYRTCLCLGLILDPDGQKMSKSKGNVVVPWDVLSEHGADAFRWYYFTSKQPWDGYRFSLDAVGESVRQFLKPLWNTYAFYVQYANLAPEGGAAAYETELDRWIRSRLSATTERVIERMDDYDTTFAGRAIAEFVDDLSNWYVRLSRRRFWRGDDPAAFETLRHCLVVVSQLLAPLTPFVTDEIYDNLDGSEPSIHLSDFPEPGPRDEQLEWRMQVVRDAVELGRAARGHAKMKVRQPLREVVVVAADRERDAIEGLESLLVDELNVKSVRYVSEADELGRFELKPNWRALGPRFGKQMPQVAAAISALDPTRLRAGERVGINFNGQEHEIGPEDVTLVLQPLDGYQVERSGTHAVALNLELDPELRREGLAREVVHAVQAARKNAGFEVEDRISLTLGGDEELLAAAREHEDYVAGETLATSLTFDGAQGDSESTEIEGRQLSISVRLAGA